MQLSKLTLLWKVIDFIYASIVYHFQPLAFQETGNTQEMIKKLSRKLKGLAHALTKVSYIRELESWAFHAGKKNINN